MNISKILLGLGVLGLASASMFSFAWDNDNFIDDSFWAEYDALGTQGAKDALLINALYGDGNGNTDRTAYTERWGSVGCNIGSMNISEQNPGWSMPFYSSANTIYLVNSGEYISYPTALAECSVMIGRGEVIFYTSTNQSNTMAAWNSDVIFDNITLNARGNGAGGTHTDNTYNLNVYNGNDASINNVRAIYGGFTTTQPNAIFTNNSIENGNISLTNVAGVVFDGFTGTSVTLLTNNVSNLILNDMTVNNGRFQITNGTNNVTGTNLKLYNNNSFPAITLASNNNYFENLELYGNGTAISIAGGADYNTINKAFFYNNTIGVNIDNADHNSINNSQFFNNASYGLRLSDTSIGGATFANIINNSAFYNNGMGIQFRGSDNNVFNNIKVFNNGTGLGHQPGYGTNNNIYYGELQIFGNDTNTDVGLINFESAFDTGTDGFLGWSNGVYEAPSDPISYHDVVVPRSAIGVDLYNKYEPAVNWRGRDNAWVEAPGVTYDAGQFVYVPIMPAIFSGNDIITINGSTGTWYELLELLLECFQPDDISILDSGSICFGIQESSILSLVGQLPLLRTEIQDQMSIEFDFTIQNISSEAKNLGYVRTKLGRYPVNKDINPEQIVQVENVKAVVFKKDEFESIAKNPAY